MNNWNRSKSPGLALICLASASLLANANSISEMQPISHFSIDRTEVTVGQFAQFVNATGFVTKAERDGGGLVYEAGWAQKSGWDWRSPYGQKAEDDEPAVHVANGSRPSRNGSKPHTQSAAPLHLRPSSEGVHIPTQLVIVRKEPTASATAAPPLRSTIRQCSIAGADMPRPGRPWPA
jgi:hypothetical protein